MLESIKHILPEIYLSLVGIVALLRGLFATPEKSFNKSFFAVILGFIATILLYIFAVPVFEISQSFPIKDNEFLYTSYNLIIYVKVLILICATVLLVLQKEELKRLKNTNLENNFILLSLVLGSFIVVSSLNLFVIFLGIELINFCLYIMFGTVGDDSKKTKTAARYFVISALATGTMLYGISLLFLSFQSVNLGIIGASLAKQDSIFTDFKTFMGLFLLGSGILTKLGIFPFQYYIPKIAQNSNRVVFGVVLSIVKITFLTLLLQLLLLSNINLSILTLGLVIAIIGIYFSGIICYTEKNVDRLLAYSSVHNTCFVLIGIFMLDYKLFIYYQTLYVLLILSVISFLVSFKINNRPIRTFTDFALAINTKKRDKVFGLVLLGLISGVPPIGMFFGKFLVVKSLVYSEYYLFSFLVALGGILMIGAFLKIIRDIFVTFDENSDESSKSRYPKIQRNVIALSLSYALLILALLFGFIFSFI
ncbi:MAG: hypothetical protein GY793_06155 [Proteobacteria bacterium]|nr:hypothetical protein [Pseudomonadota bacterium]